MEISGPEFANSDLSLGCFDLFPLEGLCQALAVKFLSLSFGERVLILFWVLIKCKYFKLPPKAIASKSINGAKELGEGEGALMRGESSSLQAMGTTVAKLKEKRDGTETGPC